MAGIDPVKLCCGHRQSEHRGPQCPDGKVMCCLCFDRFDVADLADDSDGATIDVCKACHEMERRAMEARNG